MGAPAAPSGGGRAGDEANYYFLGGAPTAAPTREDARAFDVTAIRADFPSCPRPSTASR